VTASLTRARLLHQRIARPRESTVADLVRWMGAVQAQDYLGSLWAVGLRLPDFTEADVEKAVAERAIVRTWPMRGTLHYVAASDVRWMLPLLTPRVIARSARRHRQLGLDDVALKRSRHALERALRGGRALTRSETYAVIERAGVSTEGQRGIHIVAHLAQRGVLCYGPRQGRQPTFVLLDEWVPASPERPREAALADLAARYFASHGPATLHDFAWWSGLLLPDARAGIDAARAGLVKETIAGRSCWSARSSPARLRTGPVAALLPPWDEYVVAYKDRAAALGHLPQEEARVRYAVGNWLVVVDGRVCGAWRRTLTPLTVRVALDFWTRVTPARRRAVREATARYARFLGRRLDAWPESAG
jgi:hypothetical protein